MSTTKEGKKPRRIVDVFKYQRMLLKYYQFLGKEEFLNVVKILQDAFADKDKAVLEEKIKARKKFNNTRIGRLVSNPTVPDVRSLNYEMRGKDGDSFELQDTLVAPDTNEAQLNETAMNEALDLFFASKTLTPFEKLVLRLHYGIDGGHPHNLDEISERLHISRDNARQIEGRAIGKAKTFFRKNGINAEGLLG